MREHHTDANTYARQIAELREIDSKVAELDTLQKRKQELEKSTADLRKKIAAYDPNAPQLTGDVKVEEVAG